MSGEASWYESVVALVRTHLPATAGESTGVTVVAETGEENVTEIVVFGATPCAPAIGVVVRSDNRVAPERADPERDEVACEFDDAFVDPERPGTADPFVKNSTAARTTTAPPRRTHGRKRKGLPPLDSRTFMASAQDVADSQSDDTSVRGRIPRRRVRRDEMSTSCSGTSRRTTAYTCTDGSVRDHRDRNRERRRDAGNGPKIAGDGSTRAPAAQHPTHTSQPHGAPLTLR